MRAIYDRAAITLTELSDMPGFDTPEDAEITTMVKSLAGANDSGKVSFGTEAGLFNDGGIPTIVCGPGNVEQAHKPNEFISRSQLAACDGFLGRLLDRLSAD
jgi:acetylornithine deacetylase